MYYQFDSRLNLPAISFDDDRIIVAGKEYYYTDLKDVEISKAPLLATYGIMELKTKEKSVPVPFAKADLHRLRTAVQEAKHLIQVLNRRKLEDEKAAAEQVSSVRQADIGEQATVSAENTQAEPDKSMTAGQGASTSTGQGASTSAGQGASTSAGQGAGTSAGQGAGTSAGQGAGTLAGQGEGAATTAAREFYSYGTQRPMLDPYEEMKKLKELLDLDIITQEEFARKKKELLGL